VQTANGDLKTRDKLAGNDKNNNVLQAMSKKNH
jgi:hypothetical protein